MTKAREERYAKAIRISQTMSYITTYFFAQNHGAEKENVFLDQMENCLVEFMTLNQGCGDLCDNGKRGCCLCY